MTLLYAAILCTAIGNLTPATLDSGAAGQRAAARAAVTNLPADLPAFLRGAADPLVHPKPEPDRWRDRHAAAMDEAWKYDHCIDVEVVPAAALQPPARFSYLLELHRLT